MANQKNYPMRNKNLDFGLQLIILVSSISILNGAAIFKNLTSGDLYEIPTISPAKESTGFELGPLLTTTAATSTSLNLSERAGEDDTSHVEEGEDSPKKGGGRDYGGGYFIAAPPPRFSQPMSTTNNYERRRPPIPGGRPYQKKNGQEKESNHVYGGDGDDDDDDEARHHDDDDHEDEDEERNPWNSVDLWQPHEERKKNGEFPRPTQQDGMVGGAAAAEEKEDEDDDDRPGNAWLPEMGLEARGRRMLSRVMKGVNTVCSTLFPFVEAMGSERFCVKESHNYDDDDA